MGIFLSQIMHLLCSFLPSAVSHRGSMMQSRFFLFLFVSFTRETSNHLKISMKDTTNIMGEPLNSMLFWFYHTHPVTWWSWRCWYVYWLGRASARDKYFETLLWNQLRDFDCHRKKQMRVSWDGTKPLLIT